VVELNLDLGELEFGAQGLIGTIEPNVFCHHPLVPTHSQPRKLKVDSAFVQFLQQRFLYKTREADLIYINQATEDHQNEKP